LVNQAVQDAIAEDAAEIVSFEKCRKYPEVSFVEMVSRLKRDDQI